MKEITAREYKTIARYHAHANRPYAVMEMRDGEPCFAIVTCVDAETAEEYAAWWRENDGGDYQAYHITGILSTIEGLKSDPSDHIAYALGAVMSYLLDECTSLVESNGSLVYGKMDVDESLRYCRQHERYDALRDVLYVASTLAGVEVSVPDFPEPTK